jgi:hypothetical protein
MKRALPEQFVLKFQNHGVLPQQGGFISFERCQCFACALSIEAIDATDIETTHSIFPYPNDQQPWDDGHDIFAELGTLAGLSRDYVIGLSDGWEGVAEVPSGDAYDQGYADGRAAFLACRAAGLL